VLHMHSSSTLHPPFTIKKINFKQKRWTKGDEGRIFSISRVPHDCLASPSHIKKVTPNITSKRHALTV